MTAQSIKAAADCRFDAVSLGEVMLRLDPGAARIHTARHNYLPFSDQHRKTPAIWAG
ncbi:MAG: hypothetical protein H7X95_11375, partial [Deltaproteobacteria bacterium]|nr:hypothetical protein [Deltaproteobacteria bacterium]